MTTTNLSDFGAREREMLVELLTAWNEQGLPNDFYDEDVTPMMNTFSGCVFLTNSEFQAAMMNGDRLETWYNTPYQGHEGFAEDLRDEYLRDADSWNSEDIEYITDLGIISQDEAA